MQPCSRLCKLDPPQQCQRPTRLGSVGLLPTVAAECCCVFYSLSALKPHTSLVQTLNIP